MSKLLKAGLGAALGALFIDLIGTATNRARIEKALDQEPEYTVRGPLVSVIVPALEEQDYLPLLLESVVHQTYRPIEVLIVDSSPPQAKAATEAVAARYGAWVIDVPKLGVSIARNRGAEASKGKVLLFCDADCIMAQDFIELLVEELLLGAVLAHGVDCIYDNFPIAMMWTPWQVVKPAHYTSGRGVAIRRQHFQALGGYDEACDPMKGYREDLELGGRVIAAYGSERVVLVRDALVGTSARREEVYGVGKKLWSSRGVR